MCLLRASGLILCWILTHHPATLQQVLALKLIWMLFAARGSLWVSWIRLNRIGSANFSELQPRRGDSWIWKKLCKLRSNARLYCMRGTPGITTGFWHDNWTDLGPLIHLTGERARQSRVCIKT